MPDSVFLGTVFAGRRSQLGAQEIERLRSYNDALIGITVRTYDHLADLVVAVSENARSEL
jgi:hypothetical protein